MIFPGHVLHEKGLQKTNGRLHNGQQPGTKSAPRGPADKPRVNIWFVLSLLFPDMPCTKRVHKYKKRRRSTGQQPGTKSASRPGDKPRVKRLSTADFVLAFGKKGISLVRASGEKFKRHVFDALAGARDACLLGELFCQRPVLPDPARPPRCAPRHDPLVVCPGFELDSLRFT